MTASAGTCVVCYLSTSANYFSQHMLFTDGDADVGFHDVQAAAAGTGVTDRRLENHKMKKVPHWANQATDRF